MTIVYCVLRQTGDDALQVHVEEILHRLFLALCIFMTIGAHHRIALLGGIVFDAVEHGRIIVGNEIGNDDTYHLQPPCEGSGQRDWAYS